MSNLSNIGALAIRIGLHEALMRFMKGFVSEP